MTALMPPEWAPQDWIWIGFPHLAEEWPGWLEPAQVQMAAFASAVAESGQQVRLLVRDEANEARARSLVSSKVTLERRVYGDIWLRDTGPLVVKDGTERIARRFGFNGWGGKYLMPGDQEIGEAIARDAGLAHCPDLLQRRRNTRSQEGRDRPGRFRNVSDAFRVHPRHAARIKDRPVLLVDDVMTSGATLAAGAEACRAAGAASVSVLVLARVAKDA